MKSITLHFVTTILLVIYGFFNIIYGFILMTYPRFPFLLGFCIVVLGLSFHFIAIEIYSFRPIAKWLAFGAFIATSIIALLIDLDLDSQFDLMNNLIRNLFSLLVLIMIWLNYKDKRSGVPDENG
jgi:hypothetical protein